MLTDRDIGRLETRLKKIFATKEDIADLKRDINFLDIRIDNVERKVDKFYGEYKDYENKIYTYLDGFAATIKSIDENHEILMHCYGKLSNRMDKLEVT